MTKVVLGSIDKSLSIANGIQPVIIVVTSLGHSIGELAGAAEWSLLLDHVSGASSHLVRGLVDNVLVVGDHLCNRILKGNCEYLPESVWC